MSVVAESIAAATPRSRSRWIRRAFCASSSRSISRSMRSAGPGERPAMLKLARASVWRRRSIEMSSPLTRAAMRARGSSREQDAPTAASNSAAVRMARTPSSCAAAVTRSEAAPEPLGLGPDFGQPRLYARRRAEQEHVGAAPRKKAVRHRSGNVVQLGLECGRVEDRQPAAIEDQVGGVGREVLAQHRLRAAPQHLAPDVAARHRNHLDRQRKLAEHGHELRGVADADEVLRHGGDDLLARQRPAAALDHGEVLGHLVRTVDVDGQLVDAVQVEDADAVLLQPLGARLRSGDRALDPVFYFCKRINVKIDGRAGSDAHDRVLDHVFQRRLGDLALELVLGHFFFTGGRSVQTPSKSSAAMPTDSLTVGCGWMVLPTSVASAPISTASAISLIKSPAPVPTMPPPITW